MKHKSFLERVSYFQLTVVGAWFVLIANCGMVDSAQCARPSNVQAIEEAALQSRQSLRSGHVELHSVTYMEPGPAPYKTRSYHCDIYFQGDKIRGDYVEVYNPLGTDRGNETAKRRVARCFADGVFRFFSDQRHPVPRAAEIRSLDDSLAKAFYVPDPRKIGMCPSDTQSYKYDSLNYLCGNTVWTFIEDLGSEQLRGINCLKWKYRKDGALPNEGPKDQNTLTAWVSPDHSNSVVGMRRDAPGYAAQVECDLQNVAGYGWFPSHVVFTRWDGGKVKRREELDIIVHQFNEPIKDESFELAGMGVPLGASVIDYVSDRNHAKVLKMTEHGPVEVERKTRSKSELASTKQGDLRRTLLIANGFLVGTLALFFLWRHTRAGG